MTTVVRQHIGDGSAAKNAPGEIGDDYIQVLDFQTVYDEQGAVDNWVTHFNMVTTVTSGDRWGDQGQLPL